MIFQKISPHLISFFRRFGFFKSTENLFLRPKIPLPQVNGDHLPKEKFRRLGDMLSDAEKKAIKEHAIEVKKHHETFSAY